MMSQSVVFPPSEPNIRNSERYLLVDGESFPVVLPEALHWLHRCLIGWAILMGPVRYHVGLDPPPVLLAGCESNKAKAPA